MNSQKLHEYFTENHSRGIIDHAVRADVDDKGRVSFYIHPHGTDGNTLDFWVLDDTFFPKGDVTPEEMIQIIKDCATAPEPTVEWRMLYEGEILQRGDEIIHAIGEWFPVSPGYIGKPWSAARYRQARRGASRPTSFR